MQALLEFAPLVAFFVAYRLGGLYMATAVLMGAMVILLIVDYLRLRRIPPMHTLSAVLVFLFGAATLLLHDVRFIQWKPTAFFWLASIAFLASHWIGKQTLTQRLLSAALGASQASDGHPAQAAKAAPFAAGNEATVREMAAGHFSNGQEGEDIRVTDSTWKRLNLLWVVFYAILGALNLLVAFNLSEHVWVTFKFLGLPIANLVFVGAQVAWLVRRFSTGSREPSPQS